MTTAASQRTCLITGSRGYLGSAVKTKFQREGWKVVELIRNPLAEELRVESAIQFCLGGGIAVEQLRGADALVHCAHDFSLRHWEDIQRVNVLGAEKLFQAAREAGVRRQVFISSMSAFEGCRSNYGSAKLELEKRLRNADVFLVRPGLIYGEHPKGIFGKLVRQVKDSAFLPLFDGGGQVLYLTHEDDLCNAIYAHANGQIPASPEPVTAAHEQGWALRAILEELARAQGKQLRFIPVPWRPVWLAMWAWEICRLPAKFRSDSLLSLMHQNLNPSFELTRRLGLKFRPFQAAALDLNPAKSASAPPSP